MNIIGLKNKLARKIRLYVASLFAGEGKAFPPQELALPPAPPMPLASMDPVQHLPCNYYSEF